MAKPKRLVSAVKNLKLRRERERKSMGVYTASYKKCKSSEKRADDAMKRRYAAEDRLEKAIEATRKKTKSKKKK